MIEPCDIEWPVDADEVEEMLNEIRDEQSRLFVFDEFDDESKAELLKIVKAIREQFIINGRNEQFWFQPTRVSDSGLTEQVIIKWLHVLEQKRVMHFCIPEGDEDSLRRKDGLHDWSRLRAPLETGLEPLAWPGCYKPGIAIDTLYSDLDMLIGVLSSKKTWGKFSLDSNNRYLYDGVELTKVNKSDAYRALLSGFLAADNHILSAEEVNAIVRDDGTGQRRRKYTSELGIALRKASHDINVVTTRKGKDADHFQLTIK